MNIANIFHTVGARKRWILSYESWLDFDAYLTNITVTSSSATLIVDTVDVLASAKKAEFFLNGGLINETATLTVVATTSRTEVKHDTITVQVVAP